MPFALFLLLFIQQIETTASGGGYFRVLVDGVQVSQHSQERNAVSRASSEAIANPQAVVEYRQELSVRVRYTPPAEPEPEPRVTIDGNKVLVDGRQWITLSKGAATGGDHLTIAVPENTYAVGSMSWQPPVTLGPGGVTFTKSEQPQTFWIKSSGQYVHFVGPSACYGGDLSVLASRQLPEPSTIKVYWTDNVDDLAPKRAALDALRQQYPMVLDWQHRRPIGVSFPNQHVGGTNRWLWSYGNADEFAAGFRAHIQACIDRVKSVDGQGVIVWSLEGQYNGHPISYIGDPEQHERFAPEVTRPLAKELFRMITDAGLKAGVCVRPNTIREVEWNTFKLWQFDVPDDQYEANLRRKIKWAYDELGCRLFYVDSVQRSDSISRNPQYNDPPLTAAIMPPVGIWQRLHAEFPDALLIPEQSTPAYRSVTMPFTAGIGGPGVDMQYAYPTSGNFLFGQNVDWSNAANVESLRSSVAGGNIATFNAWYPGPDFQAVKSVYSDTAQ